jgi:hypothetical protein
MTAVTRSPFSIQSLSGRGSRCVRHWPYAAAILVFATSRLIYRFVFHIEFDYSPVYVFVQYINPWFVQHDFLRSLLYLHQQAPLQNLLTGGCIRVFGTPAAFAVLNAIYASLGLATVLAMLHAMLRLGAARPIATGSAALYAASPATAFYENWLFYHVPVAALLTLSLVALLRYYRLGTFAAGALFFGLFAAASLFYAMLSPLLLVAVTLALLVRPPSPNRACRSPRARMLLALSIPLLVLGLDKAKTEILVGHAQGAALLWVNLAVKTFYEMRPAEREIAVRRGLISLVPDPAFLSARLSSFGALRIPHRPTGIPLLDMESTPDGSVNPHTIESVLIAEKYYKRDAIFLLEHDSDAYWRGVFRALTHDYFLSPLAYDETLKSTNRDTLIGLEGKTEPLLLPDREGTPRVLVVALPLTLLYGLYRVLGMRGTLESERSTVAGISYLLLVITYVTLATTLVSFGDFSRYRFNVDSLYVILFALMATDFVQRAARWGRRERTPSIALAERLEPGSPL